MKRHERRAGGGMLRRGVRRAAAVLLVAAALLLAARLLRIVPAARKRPLIVLFSVDTLRADRLGCYGGPPGISPRIDAFAGDSVQFMNAISQAPSTTSSHMSLFTGLLPAVHRVSNWVLLEQARRKFAIDGSLAPGIPTLAQHLRNGGYRTVGWHNGGHVAAAFGFDRGFDEYSPCGIAWGKLAGGPAALAPVRSLLRASRRQRAPLFLFLHHYLCHDPYLHAPRDIRERFLPRPEPGLPAAADDFPAGIDYMKRRDAFWERIDGGNPRHRRHVRGLYDGGVHYADRIFGALVDILRQEGAYDEALIVLLSDHGEEFWEHGGTTHRHLFVETLHVPLLVKFPGGRDAGRRVAEAVGQFDVMPTLLEYLGIEPRPAPQASSLLRLARGGKPDRRRVISFSDNLRNLRFSEGMLAYANEKVADRFGERLYNLFADPGETRNLIGRVPGGPARWRAQAAAILRQQTALRSRLAPAPGKAAALSPELERQLKALGYL
jgi:arylsulfatase A-like enzyme